MARRPRLDVPGIPQHIVQRGHDRRPCFFTQDDRRRYLGLLAEHARGFGCAVHAYALMTNHVHLLATPAEAGAVSRWMQAVGRVFVRCLNDAHGRSGTLWEGRFKACPVDSERYLLACHRYIELNPVRAGLAAGPGDYPWTSFPANACGCPDPLLSPHPVYVALGSTAEGRQASYRRLFDVAPPAEELRDIRLHTQRQRALGPETFREALACSTGQRTGIGRPGRPRKHA